MSDPAHAFQNLHLDDMPVTRSHARASQQGRSGERVAPASSRMNPLSRPVRTPVPRGHSHSESWSSRMRGGSPSRSTPSPASNQAPGLFNVDGINNEGQHIDFSLTALDGIGGQVIVSLFQSSEQSGRYAACSQQAHQRSNEPCIHIGVSRGSPFR